MTIEEVYSYFGSSYQLHKKTGLSQSNFYNWKMHGYIPITTQIRIERLTKGALKADLSHCGKDE